MATMDRPESLDHDTFVLALVSLYVAFLGDVDNWDIGLGSILGLSSLVAL